MIKAIDKIRPLPIASICPGHGPILRTHWKKYVDLSEKYAKEALSLGEKPMVFIPYVSAYHNTSTVAEAIAKGVSEVPGVHAEIHDIENMSLEHMEYYLSNCTGLLIGTPTINQNILMPVYQLFAAINPLRDKGKLASSFGSYGWSGEAEKMLETNITNLKLKYYGESLYIKFTPHEEGISKGIAFGKAFAEQMLKELATE
jgi:flavorubredoxin